MNHASTLYLFLYFFLFPNESPYSNPPTAQQLVKLDELRILAGKFSSPQDVHKILEWANIRLRQGDESFLNTKLEQLRTLDRRGYQHYRCTEKKG
jgi:hypothetical protein